MNLSRFENSNCTFGGPNQFDQIIFVMPVNFKLQGLSSIIAESSYVGAQRILHLSVVRYSIVDDTLDEEVHVVLGPYGLRLMENLLIAFLEFSFSELLVVSEVDQQLLHESEYFFLRHHIRPVCRHLPHVFDAESYQLVNLVVRIALVC